MHRTVEAVIEADGSVRLLEPIQLGGAHRALLTILDEPLAEGADVAALLSEAALRDWDRPEEEAAWSHLQPER